MSRIELFLRVQNQRRMKRMAKREQVVAEELKNQQLAQEAEKEVRSIAQASSIRTAYG